MNPALELDDVTVRFGAVPAADGVSFALAPTTIGCLLGPSGCGKTTVLRAIAGFQSLDGGRVAIAGRDVARPGNGLPPERRQVGMVFQDYALFPHRDVRGNIGFGLRGHTRRAAQARVEELLRLIDLTDTARAYPHQLSGGQQQRVALARAMAPRPEILLLDEPFSSIDGERREPLAREVRRLLREEGMTAILVTHDQHEAFAMADLIGVMDRGRLQQWDPATRLYHRPANPFVADFIGEGVRLPGTVAAGDAIETDLGPLAGAAPAGSRPGDPVTVLIRPDQVSRDDTAGVPAVVEDKAFRGAQCLYILRTPRGARLLCLRPDAEEIPIEGTLPVRLAVDRPVVFPGAASVKEAGMD
jgi:iron(III) transport system ATP-binding protein